VRTVVLRVAALALLLLLALVAVITTRTLNRLPDTVVYFVNSDATHFALEPAYRRAGGGDAAVQAARQVAALAQGPTPDEASRGLSSAVPADVRVLDARLDGRTLSIDLSDAFERGGGSALMTARLNQLFYTLSQPRTIDAVALRIEGGTVTVFGGEGIMVDNPWMRADHPDHPVW
jgi:spore germination protein GerM